MVIYLIIKLQRYFKGFLIDERVSFFIREKYNYVKYIYIYIYILNILLNT